VSTQVALDPPGACLNSTRSSPQPRDTYRPIQSHPVQQTMLTGPGWVRVAVVGSMRTVGRRGESSRWPSLNASRLGQFVGATQTSGAVDEPGGHGDQLGPPRFGGGQAPASSGGRQRPRLWARTARASQAALAVKMLEGMCASPPALGSRMASSTAAWV
jgi:hypothetical protein